MRKYTDIYSEVVAFENKGVLRYIGRMYFYELVKKYNKRLKKDDDMLQGSVKISNTCSAYAKFLFNCNKNEIKLILESEDSWLVEQLHKEFSS
jgi:fructose-1-phosphate kinase PfkB-like protein